MTSSCVECGHSILSHRNGHCLAIVTLPQVMRGEQAKGHCGCHHIQPPNSTGQQMDFENCSGLLSDKQIRDTRKRLQELP